MKAFSQRQNLAALGGALQMLALVVMVYTLVALLPDGGGWAIITVLAAFAGLTGLALTTSALPAGYPAIRSRAWLAGQALVLLPVLFFVGVRNASAEETDRGTRVGDGQVSIDGGRIFVGDGCVKVGDLTVGDCGKGEGDPSAPEETLLEPTMLEETLLEETMLDEDPAGEPQPDGPDLRSDLQSTTPQSASPSPEAQDGSSASPEPDSSSGPDASDEGCAAEGAKDDTVSVTVERVVDGDTFELAGPVKGTTTVRLIGVDTPETVDPEEDPEPFGKEASTFTEKAIEGEEVELELGSDAKDDYERLLAYAWAEEEMLNEVLLREGYGELLVIEPNDEYEECLAAAEQAAKADGLGLWASDASPSPEPTADPSSSSPEAGDDGPNQETTSDTGGAPEEAEDAGRDGFLGTLFGQDAAGADQQPSEGTTLLETTGLLPEGTTEIGESSSGSTPSEPSASPLPAFPDTPSRFGLPQAASSPPVASASPSSAQDYASQPLAASVEPAPEKIVLPESGGAAYVPLGPLSAMLPLGSILLGTALLSFGALRLRRSGSGNAGGCAEADVAPDTPEGSPEDGEA